MESLLTEPQASPSPLSTHHDALSVNPPHPQVSILTFPFIAWNYGSTVGYGHWAYPGAVMWVRILLNPNFCHFAPYIQAGEPRCRL